MALSGAVFETLQTDRTVQEAEVRGIALSHDAARALDGLLAGTPSATKALAQQANFLKDQGRLTSVAPDFSKNVTTEWLMKAQ